MPSKKFGYIRVSTLDQNTERQLDGLDLDMVFTDEASGKNAERPQLVLLRQIARMGDTVIVHSMDRLARDLFDLLEIVKDLNDRGVGVEFVKERLAFTGKDDPMAKLMLSVMGAFAEFERKLIRERQREGIAQAKKKKKYKGRKPALTEEQSKKLVELASSPDSNKTQLARDFNITRETLYKYLRASALLDPGQSAPSTLVTQSDVH